MKNFSFASVARIVLDEGGAQNLAGHLALLGAFERVFIVTDKGVSGAGLLEKPIKNLRAGGVQVDVYDGVQADPPHSMVLEAAQNARAFAPDCIIGFGGGSSMDTAKLVAHLCASPQHLDDLYGMDNAKGPRLPLVLLPTTAGTGSEVTCISVVTKEGGAKVGVVSPVLYADLALLDPALTASLPPHVSAATGIDAMVHAIEAMTSRHLKNPVSDMFALAALRRLHGAIERACGQESDASARADMMLGAMQAGQAFANAPVGAVHALAYPIGGLFHVSHGLSNALMLPAVMRFNAPVAAPVYAQIARHLGIYDGADDGVAATALADEMERLCQAIGLQRQLTQVGISADDLPHMAAEAIKVQRLLVNNPRDIDEAQILALYRSVL